jgi:hypothetical protein
VEVDEEDEEDEDNILRKSIGPTNADSIHPSYDF